jgi:hypothetical protein
MYGAFRAPDRLLAAVENGKSRAFSFCPTGIELRKAVRPYKKCGEAATTTL